MSLSRLAFKFFLSFNDIFESFKVVVLNVFFRFFYIVHADKGFVVLPLKVLTITVSENIAVNQLQKEDSV